LRLLRSFNIEDVVSSVEWNPYCSAVASCTTDPGDLYTLDLRDPSSVIRNDTKTEELFTHQYLKEDLVLLGYGNGQTMLYDLRKRDIASVITNTNMTVVGDIKVDTSNPNNFAVFGSQKFTTWKAQNEVHPTGLHLLTHQHVIGAEGVDTYKNSGVYIPNQNLLCVTDSNGVFAIYESTSLNQY